MLFINSKSKGFPYLHIIKGRLFRIKDYPGGSQERISLKSVGVSEICHFLRRNTVRNIQTSLQIGIVSGIIVARKMEDQLFYRYPIRIVVVGIFL